MLEGLQSTNSSVRSLTRSWVRGVVTKGNGEAVHRLLQPLVKILLESDTNRKRQAEKTSLKKITLTREEAQRDARYAKYYFKSLGIANPYLPSCEDQYVKMVQHYTQVFDASQILYALSLLQLVVEVDRSSLVAVVGNTVIDVSAYAAAGSVRGGGRADPSVDAVREDESPDPPTTSTTPPIPSMSASRKSVLEIVLSVCVDLLCSEYHPSLKSSALEQADNLRVKVSSVSLLALLLHEMLAILAKHGAHGATADDGASSVVCVEFKAHSPSFVSALLALCDIQKACLLLLGKVVEWWAELCGPAPTSGMNGMWSAGLAQIADDDGGGGGSNPAVLLKSLYTHLLRAVQCLVVMDTQFSHSLPIKTHPPAQSSNLVTLVSGVTLSGTALPPITPGCATASQAFFRDFLLQVLSDPALSCLHDNLLHMLTGTIANLLGQQLTALAPRLVKHLCSNIERTVTWDSKEGRRNEASHGDAQLSIVYFDSILSITKWCLFGDVQPRLLWDSADATHFVLHHRPHNPFFDIARVRQAESAKESFSPKQPSTMAWLLGVFTTAQKMGVESDGGSGEEGLFSRVGVNSQAGQHVMMLLPAAYNSMTDMWNSFHSQCGRGSEGVVEWGDSEESSVTRQQSMIHEVSLRNVCSEHENSIKAWKNLVYWSDLQFLS